MIYVLLAVILLFVSFFVALTSLIVEQRKLERINRQSEEKSVEEQQAQESADLEQTEDFKKKDTESKISELESIIKREQVVQEGEATTQSKVEPLPEVKVPLPWEAKDETGSVSLDENQNTTASDYVSGIKTIRDIHEDRANKLQGQIKVSKLTKD